jgi:hypothetical protein
MDLVNSPPDAAAGAPPLYTGTLDDLLALDCAALAALYRGARVPYLREVAGDLRGRMLAVEGLPPSLAATVRALAASERFPWRGKSFTPITNDSGEGINRVLTDRIRLFRFTTFVGPSRAGAFDAVQLDYDHSENPFFIRAIKDEIRELAPGLYLGQAYAQIRDRTHLVLYFGLTSAGR